MHNYQPQAPPTNQAASLIYLSMGSGPVVCSVRCVNIRGCAGRNHEKSAFIVKKCVHTAIDVHMLL